MTFNISLHHLSPDATAVGEQFEDKDIPAVTVPQLRQLVNSMSKALATRTEQDFAAPVIRINAPQGVFMVRPDGRELRLHTWTTQAGGLALTVDEMIGAITDPEKLAAAESIYETSAKPKRNTAKPFRAQDPAKAGTPRWVKIGGLAVLILAFNATTAWMLMKPPPDLLPPHEPLAVEVSARLIARLAGEYETGPRPGDRGMTILSNGNIRVVRYGPVPEEWTFTAQAAIVDGKEVLVTSASSVIRIMDDQSLTLFGDTYRRRTI